MGGGGGHILLIILPVPGVLLSFKNLLSYGGSYLNDTKDLNSSFSKSSHFISI